MTVVSIDVDRVRTGNTSKVTRYFILDGAYDGTPSLLQSLKNKIPTNNNLLNLISVGIKVGDKVKNVGKVIENMYAVDTLLLTCERLFIFDNGVRYPITSVKDFLEYRRKTT